jgi:hypothetical protein
MGENPCGKITVYSGLNIREPLAKRNGDFVRNGLKVSERSADREPKARVTERNVNRGAKSGGVHGKVTSFHYA